MLSCWNEDPDQRPDFGKLGEALENLLKALPVLEASQEAVYINQVLEVSAGAAGFSNAALEPPGGRRSLREAAGGVAASNEYVEMEEGHLRCNPGPVEPVKDC